MIIYSVAVAKSLVETLEFRWCVGNHIFPRRNPEKKSRLAVHS